MEVKTSIEFIEGQVQARTRLAEELVNSTINEGSLIKELYGALKQVEDLKNTIQQRDKRLDELRTEVEKKDKELNLFLECVTGAFLDMDETFIWNEDTIEIYNKRTGDSRTLERADN